MTEPARRHGSVVVVGGTSGLGRAVALALAPHATAMHLTFHDNEDLARDNAREVERLGTSCSVNRLSLPDLQTRGTSIRRLMSSVGTCDVLVNCAVANQAATATIANAESFKQVIEANVLGTYQVNAVAAQAMAATGGGCVINVSSILTRRYIVGAMGYITSKAAIEAMTRGFAKEWGGLGVRFVTVAPGPIRDTRLLESVPEDMVREVLGHDFEARLVEPSRIASVIRLLAEPEANAVNGEVITVDEGISG